MTHGRIELRVTMGESGYSAAALFTVSAFPLQFDLKSESAHTRQTQHFSRRLWAGELQKAVVLASFWAFHLACVGARAKDNVDRSTTGSKQSLSGDAISSREQRLIQGLFRVTLPCYI